MTLADQIIKMKAQLKSNTKVVVSLSVFLQSKYRHKRTGGRDIMGLKKRFRVQLKVLT